MVKNIIRLLQYFFIVNNFEKKRDEKMRDEKIRWLYDSYLQCVNH